MKPSEMRSARRRSSESTVGRSSRRNCSCLDTGGGRWVFMEISGSPPPYTPTRRYLCSGHGDRGKRWCACEHSALTCLYWDSRPPQRPPFRRSPDLGRAGAVMATRPDPRKNHLLAALPADEWSRWLPMLEPVNMPLGEVLYESGMAMTHVYFPTSSIVSLLYVMEDGASAEIAVVGNEGIVGVSLFMGGETTPSRSVVQSAGLGYRMRGQL